VSTNGLTGGQEAAGGGGESQQAPDGGSSNPGVVLPDGGPVSVANVDGGASPGATGDASLGSPGSGSPPDAGTIGQGLDDSGAPTQVDAGVSPPVGCGTGVSRVFVTSTLYSGDLGGVAGADADCLASASAQGLGGAWRAWLSDSHTAATAHIYSSPGGYVLLDGTLVASSFDALVSGSLAHAIDLTELNASPPDGYTEVWTGIDVTGGLSNGGYCGSGYGYGYGYGSGTDWSLDSSSAPTPLVGHLDAADSTWTAAYEQFCDHTTVRLYCFESCN
jgi:hypothetical protein